MQIKVASMPGTQSKAWLRMKAGTVFWLNKNSQRAHAKRTLAKETGESHLHQGRNKNLREMLAVAVGISEQSVANGRA
jgi:hypothetical protein